MHLLFLVVAIVCVNAYPLVDSHACVVGDVTLSNNLIGNTLSFAVSLLANVSCRNESFLLTQIDSLVSSLDNQTLGRGVGATVSLLGDGQCHTTLNVTVAVIVNNTNETLRVVTPILYPMSNCLVCSDTDIHLPARNSTPSQEHSPLYWYAECLANRAPLRGKDTLCGESLCVHLYRSGLYLDQCDVNNQRLMPPWYRMAVHLIARSFNYGDEEAYRDVWWLIGVELLERHCELKNNALSYEEMTARQSFFNSFLAHFKTQTDPREPLCNEIGQLFDDRYNETMSRMLFNQWYYKGFKFALPANRHMEINAIYLISFLCVMPFILVLIVLYTLYKLRQWRSKLRAKK